MVFFMESKAKIIYKNKDMLILDKKAGVVCTREGRKVKGSLEEWLEKKWGDNKLPRQGIVHRLDKGTSGLMVIALNADFREKIMKMFKERQIKKVYWALIEGDLPQNGVIKVPINRSKYQFGRFAVVENGKEAETHFKVLEKYKHENKIYSLVEVDLKTGRTHQIRVHFSYLGWPLAGDLIYGGHRLLGLERPFLQAKKLSFLDKNFETELTSDLKKIIVQL